MNLLIRTQDKSALVPCSGLYICQYYGKYMISNYHIDCPNDLSNVPIDFINLGIYKSKERALEVLDEIQRFYEGNANRIGTDEYTYFVYNMPFE